MNPTRRSIGRVLIGAFVVLTGAVLIHITSAFDQMVDLQLYAIRTAGGVFLFSIITLFGSIFIVPCLAALIALLLLVFKKRDLLISFIVTLGGAGLSDYLLKLLIARPRPLPPLPVSIDTSFSYPSGHATASMALYGYLVFLAWVLLPHRWQKILATIIGTCIILLIGFSRLYLGMHFPTDIAGGYLLSGIWLCIGTALYINTRPIESRV